ncbi:MAG: energy transducer TonB [Prevotella sp.]|jgi:TonB family protein|nr:energy transducer TonB [Prevotella sp.]
MIRITILSILLLVISQNIQAQSETITDSIYIKADEMPQFPGGEEALVRHISSNLSYPRIAIEAGVQGRVVARFVVGATGLVRDIEIMRSLHPECDKEVIRVINLIPQWIPGKMDDENVSVYFTLPVIFRLPHDYITDDENDSTEEYDSTEDIILTESEYGPADSAEEFISNFERFMNEIYLLPDPDNYVNDFNTISKDYIKFQDQLNEEQVMQLVKILEDAQKQEKEK